MKKTIYILTLLAFLFATFAMFCCVGCESQTHARPVLYVFCIEGCGPCLDETPLVDAIKSTGRVIVVYGNAEMAEQRNVHNYPTYVVSVAGRDVWRGGSIMPLYSQIVGAR